LITADPEQRIAEFMDDYDIENDADTRRGIISLLEDFGVSIDACSGCGEIPMTTNCNNARCQDLA
jgi:hypothetical protein